MRKEHIDNEIERLILQAAKENNIAVISIAVGIDHVHVHAALPFDMSPSKALMLLKGSLPALSSEDFQTSG